MTLLRRLSTASRLKSAFYARTTIAPHKTSVPKIPTNFSPRSALFLSTPQNLPATIENAIFLYQQLGLQIVVAGVDRTVPNGASNGVSELWLESPMKIGSSSLLASKDQAPPLRESDGISPVGAKVNWRHIYGELHLNIEDFGVTVALANTAFATRTLTTLFFFQKAESEADKALEMDNMGKILSELHVTLPVLTPPLQKPVSLDRWISLTGNEILKITNCTGNLLKGINKQPASSFLLNNQRLMDLASKETKVYVKIFEKDSESSPKKYEVIAGGGGWGPKADLLAISPEARLKIGDRLEFYMVKPSYRFEKQHTASVSNQFRFECAPEATSYEEHASSTQSVEHLFGSASELGFSVDGVNYKSAGESISFGYSH